MIKNLRDAIGVISFLLLAGFFTLLLVNTELGFGWYILLCIIALGFSAFLPSMLDSSNKNKQIENQKRELERIKLVEEALQPQVDIVERMMNDANPLSDIEQTRQLSKACKLMQIQLLDHIIISSGSFYSFTDEQTCKFNSKS